MITITTINSTSVKPTRGDRCKRQEGAIMVHTPCLLEGHPILRDVQFLRDGPDADSVWAGYDASECACACGHFVCWTRAMKPDRTVAEDDSDVHQVLHD
jgi:hypothetical protein